MDKGTQGDSNVKTTETVFTIVETLKSFDGATLTELATQLDYATSTVHSHLTTLRNLGYVTRKGDEYYLSMRFLDLGNYVQYRGPEFKLVEPAIEELAERSGERASFIVSEHGLGNCVFTSGGSNAVQLHIEPGDSLYLHCTAAGKVIMACMPPEEVSEIIERRGLPKLTSNTIVDEDPLLAELERVREEGIAYNFKESVDGMIAIGTTVTPSGATEPLGSISISGPAHRMEDERLEGDLQDLLLGTANEIEINIDHST